MIKGMYCAYILICNIHLVPVVLVHGVREEISKGKAGVAPRNREGDSLKRNLTGILFLLCIQDCRMLEPLMCSRNICLLSMTNRPRKRFNMQLEPKRATWNLGCKSMVYSVSWNRDNSVPTCR